MVWKKLFESSHLELPIDGLFRKTVPEESIANGTNELANRVVRLGNVTKSFLLLKL